MLPRTVFFDRLDWCQTGGEPMRKCRGNTRGNAAIAGLLSALVLAFPATAQTPSTPATPTQASSQTPPRILLYKHMTVNCDIFLPTGIAVPPTAAPTLFSFRLATDGTYHDIALYRTSGNSDLDKAALACADVSYLTPVVQAGSPIEINWIEAVAWNQSRPLHTI